MKQVGWNYPSHQKRLKTNEKILSALINDNWEEKIFAYFYSGGWREEERGLRWEEGRGEGLVDHESSLFEVNVTFALSDRDNEHQMNTSHISQKKKNLFIVFRSANFTFTNELSIFRMVDIAIWTECYSSHLYFLFYDTFLQQPYLNDSSTTIFHYRGIVFHLWFIVLVFHLLVTYMYIYIIQPYMCIYIIHLFIYLYIFKYIHSHI